MELLLEFLTRELQLDSVTVAENLWTDYQRAGRKDPPGFLRELLPDFVSARPSSRAPALKRQARHAGAA
jgi:hypothetical protein